MNVRRQKLAHLIALQAAAAAQTTARGDVVADVRAYPVREPVSRRSYAVLRVRTRAGLTGWGECARVTATDLDKVKRGLIGQPATSYGVASAGTELDGGLDMALLDIAAKACSTPVYRLLGGPTRFKARALATLNGSTDGELESSLAAGIKAGHRAFQAPLPATTARNQGQAFDRAVRARMEALRSAGARGVNFVLDGAGILTAGDAASVAASLESFHLLWLNDPCPVTNLNTIRKISNETVTPLGFGRDVREASMYQDLLREGIVDVLRPDLHRHGISGIRQIAALAETYYVAVAPHHEGGPIATAAALHLAASLPNFFIQHIPSSTADADRRMRAELVSQPLELVRDGFAELPQGPGLGVEVNEKALEKYAETLA